MKVKLKNKTFLQFIKFGLVGCSNTLISLAIYYILIFVKVNYIIAYIIGFIVSVLNAFYWNNKYVFKNDKDNTKLKLIRTYESYGVTFILSNVLLYLQVDVLSISEILAPLICLTITIPLNFIINKFWVYKE